MGIELGIAQVDITPEAGLPLMGNYRSDYAARGVHDPLYAKAVVFRDAEGASVALLALDLCMVDRHNVDLIRRTIAARSDIRAEHVLVHATHTHSGPAVTGRLGMAALVAPHRARIDALLQSAAMAVVAARDNMAAATLTIGAAEQRDISFNRRLQRKTGGTQMNWEALQAGFDVEQIEGSFGPIDPQLVCMGFERDERSFGTLVCFGLHPAILAGDNWEYSADYPAQLAAALTHIEGADFRTVFLNGCCGNVNHVDYRDPQQGRGHQMTQRVGYMLAATTAEALRSAVPCGPGPIRVARTHVLLPRWCFSAAELDWCKQVLQRVKDVPPAGQVDGLPDSYFAELRLAMARQQDMPDAVEVLVIRIGELAIVGLPGEVFCEIGLEIKRRSPAASTLVLGLCNDAIGYLPTRAAFAQGGYETLPGSTFYQPGAAERLMDAALRLLAAQWRS